jgi:hypothetical protein
MALSLIRQKQTRQTKTNPADKNKPGALLFSPGVRQLVDRDLK